MGVTTQQNAIDTIDRLNQDAWKIHNTDPKKGLELSEKAKSMSEASDYDKGLAYAIRNMGVSHRYQSNLETALSLSLQALEMFEKLKDGSGTAQGYSSIGAIYYYMGDYDMALSNMLKAISTGEKSGNKEAQTSAYNGAGYIYGLLGDKEKGLEFLHKALKFSKEIKNYTIELQTLDSLATAYANADQLDKAHDMYLECLKLSKKTKQVINEGYALFGLGELLYLQDKFEQAKEYLFQSLELRREIGYKVGEANSLLHIGKVYLKEDRHEKSEGFFTKALKVANEIKAIAILYETHEGLAHVYEAEKDFKNFVEHYKQFQKYKSEVFKEKQESRQKNLKMQHEVEKLQNEAEINRLNNVVLKEANDELKKKTKDLKKSYENISLLSKIGQDITLTLDLETILNTVYENVNQLMDATVFGIGIYNEDKQEIDYRMAIEKGKRYQPYTRTMEDKNQFPVWCLENKNQIFINNVKTEYSKYIEHYHDADDDVAILEDGTQAEVPTSLIYLPLLAKEKVIGLITVQSFSKNAYEPYQLDVLKTLASYTSAALYNARAFKALQTTLDELRTAQEQLVQAEKLASLGQLTAGIAHEINNPINFVSSNVAPLKEDLKEVVELIHMYEKVIEEKGLYQMFSKAITFRKESEMEIVLEEIDDLMSGIEEGAIRTSEIVKGLKNFSRLDQNVAKQANINDGIESTLTLLHSAYKGRITINKEFGNLPPVICFPGQINQVFMNILSNAIQAINSTGTITIKTWTESDMVKISIKDTGTGIKEETLKRIFDPFFTTKNVGKGTGLGLSISYGIIEKHKGKIEVFSELSKGTEFVITIPVTQE
jgi:signal transduction histidine kinase/Tfp pilus assembly protein PilF